jgi:hypothetical protein
MNSLRNQLILSLEFELKRVRKEWRMERDSRQKKVLAVTIIEAQNALERAKNSQEVAA